MLKSLGIGAILIEIVAAVGLLTFLIGSPSESGRKYEQPNTQQQATKTQQPALTSADQKPNEGSSRDQPCEPGQDNRSSDLCAQWKAADAAKESAEWAGKTYFYVVIGTIIGGFTVAAAVAAAAYAASASWHAGRSANAAVETLKDTRRQLAIVGRAVLRVSQIRMEIKEGCPLSGRFLVINDGYSVAKIHETYSFCKVLLVDGALPQNINDVREPRLLLEYWEGPHGEIGGGGAAWCNFGGPTPKILNAEDCRLILNEKSRKVYVAGSVVFYDSQDIMHRTVFCRIYVPRLGNFRPEENTDFEYQS